MKKLITAITAALVAACLMSAVAMADVYDYDYSYDYGYDYDYSYDYETDLATYQDEWNETVGCLNSYDGIYWFGDRLETYYSSNVAYHYMTPEWWLDDEGFYRTDEGYYVIAASDYEYGSIIEGSKGLCQVLDCGPDAGISDYYVCW